MEGKRIEFYGPIRTFSLQKVHPYLVQKDTELDPHQSTGIRSPHFSPAEYVLGSNQAKNEEISSDEMNDNDSPLLCTA